MSREKFQRLIGQKGTRKMTSERLAVIDKSVCEREPWLPTLAKIAEFQERHGFQPYRRAKNGIGVRKAPKKLKG
jgi:hypothetical protein